MNTDVILWQQASSAFETGILSHNGKQLAKEDLEYADILDQVIITDFSFCKILLQNDVLQIFQDEEETIYILSNFEEKDENGRRIAFVAKICADSRKEAISAFQKELSFCNKHISETELGMIKVTLYRKIIALILGTILAVAILLIVLITKSI